MRQMKLIEEEKPIIICLCGSTRFKDAFQKANLEETLAGKIVLSVGCYTHSDKELNISEEQKKILDELHLRKIDLADEVLILNVGGYLGDSTVNELNYANRHGKRIRFLEDPELHKDTDNRLVTVCSECIQASCWQGIFMCDDAREAGTVERTVRQLKELGHEHPSYWIEGE